MTWQKKHDIILGWIDGCTTLNQLQSLIPFVKSQSFDVDNLLFMIRLKSMSVYLGVIVDTYTRAINIFEE